jgi:hypothetical protein
VRIRPCPIVLLLLFCFSLLHIQQSKCLALHCVALQFHFPCSSSSEADAPVSVEMRPYPCTWFDSACDAAALLALLSTSRFSDMPLNRGAERERVCWPDSLWNRYMDAFAVRSMSQRAHVCLQVLVREIDENDFVQGLQHFVSFWIPGSDSRVEPFGNSRDCYADGYSIASSPQLFACGRPTPITSSSCAI